MAGFVALMERTYSPIFEVAVTLLTVAVEMADDVVVNTTLKADAPTGSSYNAVSKRTVTCVLEALIAGFNTMIGASA